MVKHDLRITFGESHPKGQVSPFMCKHLLLCASNHIEDIEDKIETITAQLHIQHRNEVPASRTHRDRLAAVHGRYLRVECTI